MLFPGHRSSEASFNSATALRPWRTGKKPKPPTGGVRLQFGHGTEAVENAAEVGRRNRVAGCFNSATALRPWRTRQWNRMRKETDGGFNSATALRPWKTQPQRLPPVFVLALQFGHGTEAVETAGSLRGRLDRIQLQFGHGTEAVENLGRASPTRPSTPCFNSATALRPWKTSVYNDAPRRTFPGFNSATALRPWKTGRGRGCSPAST